MQGPLVKESQVPFSPDNHQGNLFPTLRIVPAKCTTRLTTFIFIHILYVTDFVIVLLFQVLILYL